MSCLAARKTRVTALAERSTLEEEVWWRNLLEVSLPLPRSNHTLTFHWPYSPYRIPIRSDPAATPATLSKEQRQEIARKAAAARWGKKP